MIRHEAGEKLAAMRVEIDALDRALRVNVDDLRLPVPAVPTANLNGHVHGVPLLDSRWSFSEQSRRLIDSKPYRGNGVAA